MRHDVQLEIAKSSPAIAGAAWYSITLNEGVAIVTIVYILVQLAYLIWKWRREAR